MSAALKALVDEANANDNEEGEEYLDLLLRTRIALESAVQVAIDVDNIRPYIGQPRLFFDQESLQSLSLSIQAVGQAMPGLIRQNPGRNGPEESETEYELIDGERRWRAIKMIPKEGGRPLYKGLLITADDDVIQFLISGISNFNREDHTALEMTETIVRFRAFKIPMVAIAKLLGITVAWAHQLHGLRELTPEVQKLMDPNIPEKERLGVTAAIGIARAPAQIQKELAHRVLSKDLRLFDLRSEVVKTAAAVGQPVRVNETAPYVRYAALVRKGGNARRLVSEVKKALDSDDLGYLLKSRSQGDTARLSEDLTEMKKLIEACEARIKEQLSKEHEMQV